MEPISILITQVTEIARSTVALLPQLAVAIVVVLVTWGFKRLVQAILGKALSRTKLRQSLKDLFSLLIGIAVWVFGIMVAAVIVFPGLTPASILAGLGIGSVAIGFAFKDVFENFLAGIIILFRREMRIGDHIECNGIEGHVDHIAIRESHILRTDGQLVIGDRECNNLPPKDRGIAMVFQNYALYPHMTAYENLAFGLETAKKPKTEIKERVIKAAELLEITDLLGWYIFQPHKGAGVYYRTCFVARPISHDPKQKLDTGILEAEWLSPDEFRARRHQHRSALVEKCLDDYLSGRRLPLDSIYQHPWPLQRG